ncbi:MAG: glycosyltransferase [Acidobacteria bacterium]|nr:glycosyltransferase [Acidobacteriota bacterium]
MSPNATPEVSIIVPARNEEACLGACLESLVRQRGIDYEIIVVDDASRDRTGEIARGFSTPPESSESAGIDARPAVTVISAPPLPQNWTGKNNAMAAGAKVAKGKWLLFTDADTVHHPESLARAVEEAERQRAALLSYSPEQEVRTVFEKAVMPVIFAELQTAYPPKRVSDPASPLAAANGQYLLVSRETYDALGGHAEIAGVLVEDVALARLVKSSGRKIFFRYGGDALRTRMYRSWPEMKEGWTKNLASLFPSPHRLALARGLEFILIFGSLLTGVAALSFERFGPGSIALFVALVLAARAWMRIRRAHFSWVANLLALPGLGIFTYLLVRSVSARRSGAVSWKGREYRNLQGKGERESFPTGSAGGLA